MRIKPFEYHAASDLREAVQMLSEEGADARALAGGTDLVLAMKHKAVLPKKVVSLHRITEMAAINTEGDEIKIGALATHSELAAHLELQKVVPILCQAVSLIGSWQIRNSATIGGNLAHASPAADSAAPLLALDATLVTTSPSGDENIPLASFFSGPGATILHPGQIIKEIIILRPQGRSSGRYLKLMRKRAVDLSQAGVAFQAELDPAGEKLAKVAIGLGGMAPTPIRAPEAEGMLEGLSCAEALKKIPSVARAVVAATSPIDDIRASAAYRKLVAEAFFKQAAQEVLTSLTAG
ncbi:hypothetical protein AAU61_17470 [Desulfocarbo indianensis]|nr:hypothetical protein AAU61_17470 [Desulfocarbo indianensis]